MPMKPTILAAVCTELAQKPARSPRKPVTFPVTIEFKDKRAKIYKPAKGFPFYRIAFTVAGKRKMLTFGSYGEAKEAAEEKLRELHKGLQSAGLTAKEAQDALDIRGMPRQPSAGHRQGITAREAVSSYLEAVKMLPKGSTLARGSQGVRPGPSASVKSKAIADAVRRICGIKEISGQAG